MTTVRVTGAEGAAALGKPQGTYHTLDLTGLERREEGAFPRAVAALSGLLKPLLPAQGEVLVVGLGNRAITPDAIGPQAADRTLVTRHLISMSPEHFGSFRPVAALAAGVLGTTGVESGVWGCPLSPWGSPPWWTGRLWRQTFWRRPAVRPIRRPFRGRRGQA